MKGQPFILGTSSEKKSGKKTSNGGRLNSSCKLKITICQPPLSLIHLIMVNGDIDLSQEGVCQFVGLPKSCPSLRYYQGPSLINHFTCNTWLQRRAQIFCSTQLLGKGITKLTMVSFDLQTVLPCFDPRSSSTQRLSAEEQCDMGRRQGTKVKHITIFLTNNQTCKSLMLEDSSGPATAHVRQKPTESFERWGELGRRCSGSVLLILL